VLVLRLVHGFEPAAIAHTLGAPPATVKSRLQRCLDLLRKALPVGLRAPVFVAIAPRSLEAVRDVVLVHAQVHAAAAVGASSSVATGTVVATGLAVGGVLLMKKLLLAVAGIAVAVTLASILWQETAAPVVADMPHEPSPVAAVQSATLAPAPTASPAAAERTEVAPPPALTAPVAVPATAPAVTGRVVDEHGTPLPGVQVLLGDKRFSPFQNVPDFLSEVYWPRFERSLRDVQAQQQRTDSRGMFTLSAVANVRPTCWSPGRPIAAAAASICSPTTRDRSSCSSRPKSSPTAASSSISLRRGHIASRCARRDR
jgi:hypothetical protein